jgi:hypothetical protein
MALTMINDALPFLYPGIQNIFTTDSVRNILFDGLKMSCDSEETGIAKIQLPTFKICLLIFLQK